jgi:hypothetical protein
VSPGKRTFVQRMMDAFPDQHTFVLGRRQAVVRFHRR